MAQQGTVVLTSGVVVGHQSLVTNGAYTDYDLTIQSGSWPSESYKIVSATLNCTLRNARWDTITTKASNGTILGSFPAGGTNGEHLCPLITNFAYGTLNHITMYGGGVGTQIAGGSFVTITVVWELDEVPSTFTLSSSSVNAGGSVTVTISPDDPSFSHTLTFTFGSTSTLQQIAAGTTTATLSVPMNFLNQIPSSASGVGTVKLDTLNGSRVIGSTAKSLTVIAPNSAAPTFNAACALLLSVGGTTYPNVGGLYVQGKSGCTATITGASGQYGATIRSYNIRGGGYSGTTATLITGLLYTAGTNAFTFQVSDSRGLTTTKTVNITVTAYSPPQVSSLTAWRTDAGGATNVSGTYGAFKGTWTYTSLGGGNTCTAVAYLVPSAGNQVSQGSVTSGATYTVKESAGGAAMELPLTSTYQVRYVLTDVYGSYDKYTNLPSANFALHFNTAGNSVAFGKACEHTNAIEIAEDREIWWRGGPLGGIFGIYSYTYDADNAVRIGMYSVTDTCAHLPVAQYGNLLSLPSDAYFTNITGIIDQFFLPIGGGRIWRRHNYNTNAWSDWTLASLDAYPVGSIYLTISAHSPASLFGGTWTQMQNRFLVGAGSGYPAGDMGGANTVALTAAQMPSHSHIVTYARSTGSQGSWSTASGIGRYAADWGGLSFTVNTDVKGSGATHENRPPFIAVYMWQRTA